MKSFVQFNRQARQSLLMVVALGLVVALPAFAGERLSNVPEPTLAGDPVISPDAPPEHPSMLNLGIDNIEFHPFAGAAFGYDSNIYLTHTGRVDDPFFEIMPGLLVRTAPGDKERFQFDWSSNLVGRFFVNESKANTVQFASTAGATLSTKDWNFGLKVGGGRFEDPLNTTFADRTPRAVGEGKAKATYKGFDKLSLEFGLHGTVIDYHTVAFGTLDRTEFEVPLRALYKLSDTAQVYVKTAWDLTEFRNPGLNNFYYVDSRAGFTGEFLDGKVFKVDINAGVAVLRIKNDNGSNPSVRASHIVFDSYFQYAPNQQTSVGVALYGTPRVNLAVTQPIRPVYGARLDFSYKLMENRLQLSATGLYERTDNLPTDSDQVFLSGTLRARYSFQPWAFAFISYQIQGRQADGLTLDYEENKVMLGCGATL